MKKLITLLLLGAAAGGMVLSGCSKSKTATPVAPPGDQTGTNTNTVATNPGVAMAADSPALLKIKWTAGKSFPMRMDLHQNTETKVPGQADAPQLEVNLAQDFNLSALKPLDNGGWELELKFENQTMDVSQGGKRVMSFDPTEAAAQETNNPAAARFTRDDRRAAPVFHGRGRKGGNHGRHGGADEAH